MNEYLKAQNKTNEAIVKNTFSSDELNRFSKSDYRWADNKAKPFRQKTNRVGECPSPLLVRRAPVSLS